MGSSAPKGEGATAQFYSSGSEVESSGSCDASAQRGAGRRGPAAAAPMPQDGNHLRGLAPTWIITTIMIVPNTLFARDHTQNIILLCIAL